MGLLKSGIKYGAVFMVAKEGMKAYKEHNASKTQQQNQPQQQQQYYSSRSTEQLPFGQQPQPYQEAPREIQGSFHQHWCNRQCGGKCVSAETLQSMGIEAGPAPQYVVKTPMY